MKAQDTLPSSSSHRESDSNGTEKLHAKVVGCMSGLFHLVSNYHGRRKLLTFGKRQAKNELVPTTATKSSKSIDKEKKQISSTNPSSTKNVTQRHSCEVPRSPTLPAEIRRDSVNSPHNFKSASPAGLVARLMGLEEPYSSTTKSMILSKANTVQQQLSEYSSAADKRRQLLGALEKCDRDLQALKKIINAVRSAEQLQSPTASAAVLRNSDGVNKGLEVHINNNNNHNADKPSRVSVLDESTRSPLSNLFQSKRQSLSYGRVQHQARPQKRKGEEDFINPSIFDRITCESLHRKTIVSSPDYLHRVEPAAASLPPPSSSSLWTSEAMRENVEEVCKDIAWGERREIGRIGLALQDRICRDLIEEIITDMGSINFYNNLYSPLPFEACKRRLCF
ncbi:hypothetical protein F8388_005440 [Cannabis sativa]|uniref:DUF3741 domain-containing protein n=1 Tax=Cannabis sativa TaxID=3483 RepID=A0A7J6I9B3_CANSA|nr:hypothetical protein F8388_005440 [Cannabis sativa]KAF4403260.1 hypothetical protein G4B88_028031 [Cannabis sativa]